MMSCIFDLFYPHPPKPTLDPYLTNFNVFGVSGLLGGLLLLKPCVWCSKLEPFFETKFG